MTKRIDRSLTKFVKLTIDGVTHFILREPTGRELKLAEDRLRIIYPKKKIEIDTATRVEWGMWHGLTVLTGGV